jgi:hypothetical protein
VIIDAKKKKYLAVVLSVVLAFSCMVTSSANALKAKVVKPCISPLTQYMNAKKLTPTQVYDLLKLIGFKGHDLKVAWAVAMKETHGNPLAHNYNPRTGDNSYGMFQVNLYGALKGRIKEYGLKSATDLKDPVTNAQVAFKMSSGGKNWTPWHADPGERDNRVVQYWIKTAPSIV